MKGWTMDDMDDVAFDAHGNLVHLTELPDYGPPPDYTWTNYELAEFAGTVPVGQVVSLKDHRGLSGNLCVASEPFSDSGGRWVRVVTYADFLAWTRRPAGEGPELPAPARAVPTRYVWIMHEVVRGG